MVNVRRQFFPFTIHHLPFTRREPMSEKDVIRDTKPRMDGAVEDLRRKLGTVRTGRATVSVLDPVVVDYYGTPTPLNQMASIHVPEPQTVTVQPWDQTQIGAI